MSLLCWALTFCVSPILAQPQGPRDVLREYDLNDSFFGSFVEDEPLTVEEQQKLWKTLLRVRGFSRLQMERWARRDDDWRRMLADPIVYRGELLELSGEATHVDRVPLDEETLARYQFDKLFRVRLQCRDGALATVYTTCVPSGWPVGKPMAEPAGALGLLVKRVKSEGETRLVFVAERVAWYPNTLLGKLGMDEGLFDELEQRRPLSAKDRECFYQLLHAVGRTAPGELETQAREQLGRLIENLERNRGAYAGNPRERALMERRLRRAEQGRYDVAPLFNSPASERGKLVMLEGDVRRVVEVKVDDPDIVERFGIRRYFELALFTDDANGNPLICCVRELPADMPLGENVLERARVAGFFFKVWAYPRGKRSSDTSDKPEQQLAPLLIGREVRHLEPIQFAGRDWASAIVVGAIVASLGALLWAAARTGRGPRISTPSNSSQAPDFSSLEGKPE